MPIDDALNDMKEKDEKKVKGKKLKQQDEAVGQITLTDIMKNYVIALWRHSKDAFDIEKLEPYVPWMRLKKECNTVIGPIPRDSFLEIIKKNCISYKYADLADLIDQNKQWFSDPVNVSSPDCFPKIPAWIGTQAVFDITGCNEVKSFEKQGKTLIIPDLNYMSLFIEDGKALRKYLRETGYSSDGKKNILTIFGKTMRLNCEKLDTDTAAEDEATAHAIRQINRYMQDLAEAKAKGKDIIPRLRRALYCNVKSDTPEAVIPEPDDKPDFRFFPERRRPSIDDGDD